MLLPIICDRKIRPERPENGSAERNGLNDELWTLMCRTWAHEPEQRPVASDLSKQLGRHAALVRPDPDDGELSSARRSGDVVAGNEAFFPWSDRAVGAYSIYLLLL